MPFSQLLTADRIVLLVEPGDRDGVLDAAARLLTDSAPGTTAAIGDSLRSRERLGSTAIGQVHPTAACLDLGFRLLELVDRARDADRVEGSQTFGILADRP